jgi:hypothetical protein
MILYENYFSKKMIVEIKNYLENYYGNFKIELIKINFKNGLSLDRILAPSEKTMVETKLIGVFQDDRGVDLQVLCKAERKESTGMQVLYQFRNSIRSLI